MSKLGAIILAAGMSSRMGENKVLLPWRDGKPIVCHITAKFLSAGLDSVIVVTGNDAPHVRAAVASLGVDCAHNPNFESGEILSSVKTGLRALPSDLTATFIQPADMPCIPTDVIGLLAEQHQPGWNLAPEYRGRRGHPVLLDRQYWRAMLELPAEAQPRDVIEAAAERLRLLDVEDGGVLLDVDTREAYERALEDGC